MMAGWPPAETPSVGESQKYIIRVVHMKEINGNPHGVCQEMVSSQQVTMNTLRERILELEVLIEKRGKNDRANNPAG